MLFLEKQLNCLGTYIQVPLIINLIKKLIFLQENKVKKSFFKQKKNFVEVILQASRSFWDQLLHCGCHSSKQIYILNMYHCVSWRFSWLFHIQTKTFVLIEMCVYFHFFEHISCDLNIPAHPAVFLANVNTLALQ